MTDENCRYYKHENNSVSKFCIATSRLSGRAPGDSGDLNYCFQCTSDNHEKCSHFIDENKIEKFFEKKNWLKEFLDNTEY
jgi:hypothetical protein